MPVKHILTVILALAVFLILPPSCTQPEKPAVVYDSSKNYVAFLVVNAANSDESLEKAKSISVSQGYEIGPVGYYKPGTKDFSEIVKNVMPSPQIKLIWIIGSLLDSPNIQKALSATGYQGGTRYMPVTSNNAP